MIKVWRVWFNDRQKYMLQWVDPSTGRRITRTTKTDDEKEAERQRVLLEHDLNSGTFGHLALYAIAPDGELEELIESDLLRLAHSRSRVYFIRQMPSGPIKIGTALDVNKRLSQLQVASHLVLDLIGSLPGDKELEKKIHRVFRHTRLRGEWFSPSHSLLHFIKRAIALADRENLSASSL